MLPHSVLNVYICRGTKAPNNTDLHLPLCLRLLGLDTTLAGKVRDSASERQLCTDLEQQMSWEVGEAGN